MQFLAVAGFQCMATKLLLHVVRVCRASHRILALA
jgi:hypothetical protein